MDPEELFEFKTSLGVVLRLLFISSVLGIRGLRRAFDHGEASVVPCSCVLRPLSLNYKPATELFLTLCLTAQGHGGRIIRYREDDSSLARSIISRHLRRTRGISRASLRFRIPARK